MNYLKTPPIQLFCHYLMPIPIRGFYFFILFAGYCKHFPSRPKFILIFKFPIDII